MVKEYIVIGLQSEGGVEPLEPLRLDSGLRNTGLKI